jgi:hypothetical protein
MADRSASRAPAAVLQQAVDRFELAAAAGFQPAPSFLGANPGYYFSAGPQGVGYYRDPYQLGPASAPAARPSAPPRPTLIDDDRPGPSAPPPRRAPLDAQALLTEAELAAADYPSLLVDAKGLRRLVNALERRYRDNLEARLKHAGDPRRFLESELDLDEAVKALTVGEGLLNYF